MPDVPNSRPEPPVRRAPFDNPLNPRGIPDYLADGQPSSQATDAQKVQDPTPARAATLPQDAFNSSERVSAGQNRKPPQERVP
jgi:hypothetical protein